MCVDGLSLSASSVEVKQLTLKRDPNRITEHVSEGSSEHTQRAWCYHDDRRLVSCQRCDLLVENVDDVTSSFSAV